GRRTDLERGFTSAGPHRDDWAIGLAGRDARRHASQGEQRCLALALRLAAHRVVVEITGHRPVLLLDDVFSELDDSRAEALVGSLPEGQVLLAAAGQVPQELQPDLLVRVEGGRLAQAAGR
ncbi:MAG: DNA replication/repair protein RecF, partial [Acidimicrobiia bacterium]